MQNERDNDNDDLLTFSLACNSGGKRKRQSPLRNPPVLGTNQNKMDDGHVNVAVSRSSRRCGLSGGKSETIPPPYPWATNRRAVVHTRKYLLENEIVAISGSVECKRCKNKFEMVLDLEGKLAQLLNFIQTQKETMHDRAPNLWKQPVLPKCDHCGQENSVQPLLAGTKKKHINWLFLFLGQMLGCCTLKQLKYFLKHTKMHRTGAKDRVLYSTYMVLCKQLIPDWFPPSS
ncbi:hypothetical protein VNO78_04146 [Psophocarpus tetragonolobus]|uniref:DUF7086 domain-containing protein n=1 Tax=Psophocarpus tetragonolobus TaxID=3891 RepID=A0AAN9T578_PSOTE